MTNVWMRWTAIILTTGFVAGSVVAAEPNKAADSGGSVLERVQPRAEQGNPNAQYNLGVIYDRGYGVERDYAKARTWYEKAAAQGNAAAAHNLGMIYKKGHGVPVDYKQAVHWFRKAAELGEPAAQNNLAVMYAEGMGVARNPALAAVWMARAAQAGNAAAIENLPVITAALPAAEIGGNNVNIRAQPGTQADVLTRLDAGASVVVLQQRDDWSRVLIPADYTLGWVSTSLLDGDIQLAANDAAVAESDAGLTPRPAADGDDDNINNNNSNNLLAEVREEVAAEADTKPAAATSSAASAAVADGNKTEAAEPESVATSGNAKDTEAAIQSSPTQQQAALAVKIVGADSVNVRAEPSRQAEVLFRVQRGDQVTVRKTHNGWDYIESDDGRHGWIADYLLVES